MCCVSSWRRDRITIVTHTFQTLPDSYKQNRPVDPGSIQGSHRPISFTRIKHTRTIFCVKLSMNNQIVGLVHKNRNIRTCTMYHAACKVELQPFKRSYSQLTFFQLFIKYVRQNQQTRATAADKANTDLSRHRHSKSHDSSEALARKA